MGEAITCKQLFVKAETSALREAGNPPLAGRLLCAQSGSDRAERPVLPAMEVVTRRFVLRLLAERICGGRMSFFEDAETLQKMEIAPRRQAAAYWNRKH